MEVQTTKYDIVQTGMYKDNYQAKLGYYNKAGEFKVKSYPRNREDGSEVYIPVSITIGDSQAKAVNFLLMWLQEITGVEYYPTTPEKKVNVDDSLF
jgi:hypothetical protein